MVRPASRSARPASRSTLKGSAEVLEHGAYRFRVVDHLDQFRIVLGTHLMRIGPIPGMRVSRNHPLRCLGLGKEEPVKPALSDPRVTPLQRLDDRHSVNDHKSGNTARVVHCQPEGNMTASIMSDDRELNKV
jgi:hypothetical protein